MPKHCIVVYGIHYRINKETRQEEQRDCSTFLVCFDEYPARKKIEELKEKFPPKFDGKIDLVDWWDFDYEDCAIDFDDYRIVY